MPVPGLAHPGSLAEAGWARPRAPLWPQLWAAWARAVVWCEEGAVSHGPRDCCHSRVSSGGEGCAWVSGVSGPLPPGHVTCCYLLPLCFITLLRAACGLEMLFGLLEEVLRAEPSSGSGVAGPSLLRDPHPALSSSPLCSTQHCRASSWR